MARPAGFAYAERYCEENVWKLFERPCPPGWRRSALFITNADQRCPLFCQRSAPAPGEPVVWDYHVVLLQEGPAAEIWDLDSTLPFPCPAKAYLQASFPLTGALPHELEPWFRCVPEALFLARFASDRSHMRDAEGNWQAPPPSWPAIATPASKMTLPDFLNLSAPGLGEVLDLPALMRRCEPLRPERGG